MKSDIETQLLARLFCLRNSEPAEILRREVVETLKILKLIQKKRAIYQKKRGFWVISDLANRVINIFFAISLKKTPSLPPITRRKKENLYQWNVEGKNDLVSRGFSKEEHRRTEFIGPGFYFIAEKINQHSDQLFFVTENQIPGYIKFHKSINGELYEFKGRCRTMKLCELFPRNTFRHSENR